MEGNSLEERFWSKTTQSEPDACILWTGSISVEGYGQFGRNRRLVIAHRYAYEIAFGRIPEGLQLHHLCGERRCVNPDHLEALSCADHRRRHKGWKTHCPHGHRYTPENTVATKTSRRCLTCKRLGEQKENPRGLGMPRKPLPYSG